MGQKINDSAIHEIDLEVCFVCKKCRLAFPGETPLITHQRQCYGANQESRGAFRIVQIGYECKVCNVERFKSGLEAKKHMEQSSHQKIRGKLHLPPPESPLSHEMEDVVNQITLLAARAAQETPQGLDSNSNAFQNGDAKRRFLGPPADVAPLSH